ncbi:hypothetical protein I302_100492 [Kwoniella bestiolae CBS 10118]|uniref:Uncharacterized protein n=1 Tax=Kwoniella bestiolae CBS 10118 TaxID=1296100 RepID=A0A1B9G577_9TREE|nr:hypothetical protein I302_03865 [Kwoniella bestiolae CBS 10118]OCF26187.1 hypothetical protein I302_03865 [Kwoniella bestiolae CBS 10118]
MAKDTQRSQSGPRLPDSVLSDTFGLTRQRNGNLQHTMKQVNCSSRVSESLQCEFDTPVLGPDGFPRRFTCKKCRIKKQRCDCLANRWDGDPSGTILLPLPSPSADHLYYHFSGSPPLSMAPLGDYLWNTAVHHEKAQGVDKWDVKPLDWAEIDTTPPNFQVSQQPTSVDIPFESQQSFNKWTDSMPNKVEAALAAEADKGPRMRLTPSQVAKGDESFAAIKKSLQVEVP